MAQHPGLKTEKNSPLPRYILAIDLGSGGLKAAIVSDSGQVVASVDETVTTFLLPNGGAEQDPDEWWSGTKIAIKKVIRESGVPPEDIVAVGCDSQWSVVVPVDAQGRPLMRAIHWLDRRGGPYNRMIAGGFPKIQGYGLLKLLKWLRLTGMVPTQSGVDSLGHVLFIKNERPEIYTQTHKFLEPMDYLTSRLTGKITATQKTMAPFGLVDNRRWDSRQYSYELLKLTDLPEDKFPDLIPNDGIVGTLLSSVAEDLGLQPSTKVIAGIGDSNASVIGSGAIEDFDTIIYIGTSLYMTCHVPFKKSSLTSFMTSLPSPFESRYFILGEQGAGGKCIEFFLNNLVYPDDRFNTGPQPADAYERLNKIASETPAGSDGVIFLPWLNGSIVPHENPNARGGFINLSLKTTRSHLTRAVMEGIAFNNRWTRGPAERFIGRPIEKFRFSGGGALSDVWCQIHADVLGVPIHQIENPTHTTLRGTALLGAVALGLRSIEELPELIRIKRVFEPDVSNRAVYDKMYLQYRELYKRNKKVFAALNTM